MKKIVVLDDFDIDNYRFCSYPEVLKLSLDYLKLSFEIDLEA